MYLNGGKEILLFTFERFLISEQIHFVDRANLGFNNYISIRDKFKYSLLHYKSLYYHYKNVL